MNSEHSEHTEQSVTDKMDSLGGMDWQTRNVHCLARMCYAAMRALFDETKLMIDHAELTGE